VAIPLLLKRQALTGALVTIDATGTQNKIAEVFLKRGGDYLLALRSNWPALHGDVRDLFADPACEVGHSHDATDAPLPAS